MLEILSTALLAASAGSVVWSVWALICAKRVSNFRMRLLDAIFHYTLTRPRLEEPTGWAWVAFDKVDYDTHVCALMCFRDPKKLYDPRLLALLED